MIFSEKQKVELLDCLENLGDEFLSITEMQEFVSNGLTLILVRMNKNEFYDPDYADKIEHTQRRINALFNKMRIC